MLCEDIKLSRECMKKGLLFFFASLFFLEWNDIGVKAFGPLYGKSLSMILMLIFLLINIKRLSRIWLTKWEIVATVTLLVEFIRGIEVAITNENYEGISRFVNGYLGIIIFYMGVKLCYPRLHDRSFRQQLVKTLYNGCFYSTCFMGGLQILYILTGDRVLYAVIDELTFRGLVYLDAGKVQLFTEPSLFGEIFFIVFIPSAYYMLKNGIYKKNRVLISAAIVLLINILGISVRYILDMLVFVAIWCLFTIYGGRGSKAVKTLLFVMLFSVFSYGILYFNWFGLAEQNHAIERLHNILTSSNYTSLDGSGSIRMEYLRCAWEGFVQKPILGWGAGNYVGALNANAHRIGNALADAELLEACQQKNMVSFSFVFTQLCENGMIGVIHVTNVLYLLVRMIGKKNSIIMNTVSLFIVYMFIQNEMMGCFSIAMVLAFYNFNNLTVNRYGDTENGLIKIGVRK